ncbi:MAG: ABC transporter permease [Bacteroidota bacterium]
MLKNYLLIARRNKVYLTVNVLGLALGLACCLTAYTFFAFNLEFDSYFSDTEDIYRVQRTLAGERASQGVAELIPLPLASTASEEISGVQEATRVFATSELLRTDDEVFDEYIGFTDANFFTFFPYQTKFGETESYAGTDKIIISEELA